MSSKPVVVVAVQPGHRDSVYTSETQAKFARVAEVVNLGVDRPFTAEDLAAALPAANGLFTCWGTPRVTAEMARRAPNLKVIAHSAGTLRSVIEPAVLDLGIQVTSQALQIGRAVAEFTVGQILSGLRLVWLQDRLLQTSRDWHKGRPDPDLCWELAGRTVGVVSLSRIGRLVASKLTALEAKVIAYDPYADAEAFAACGAEPVDLPTLFERATVVTVHAPVTDQTRHLIGRDLLAKLPDGALIVNTARGVILDEAALTDELVGGRLRAALDVTDPEPPACDSRLYGLPNVTLTPHQAGVSVEARRRQGLAATDDILAVLAGERLPQAVRPEQWDILA